ncbi:MAG TPA: M1 family metallopeptidase [Candidatus Kapabacteria bacterium]
MRSFRFSVSILVYSLFTIVAHAQGLGWDYQEQARSHSTDIQHIEMHLSFDEPAKKVMGTVLTTLAILPQQDPVREIQFDAVNLNIGKVWLDENGKKIQLTFSTTKDSAKLDIALDRLHPYNVPFTIGIEYWAQPKKGLWFIEPDTFYTDRQQQIWSQGEGEENRNWLPIYDYPNDKCTTDMFVTVRADQQALSNGKLMGKEKNKDGTVTWHWKESHPFSTYLIMVGIGHYEIVTDKWRGKDVDYWVYPGWKNEAHRIFGLTPDMIEFYSSRTGYPYAWEKYDQIAIADFMYGGMENVTATTENDYVMFDKRSGIDFNAEGLIAHELAHQWFGDLVTCRSWLHTWLNESFATYFEAMYRQYHDGQDEFDEEMMSAQNAGMEAEKSLGKKPIVAPNNYTANHYPRGAATLNMMRHVLGDSGWWHSIHHYLDVHQFQPVVTEDFKMAIEEATGQNLAWFFDEWLYKSGHPIFDVNYRYDADAKIFHMTVAQTQKRDTLTGTFKMPVDLELTLPDGSTILQTLHIEDSLQQFQFPCPQQPAMVIFDKGNTLIKELNIHNTPVQWEFQLLHAKRSIERSVAAIAMQPDAMDHDRAAFESLKTAATRDSFWAVRLHALTMLGNWAGANFPILDLLLDRAQHDQRPDVRTEAVQLLIRTNAPQDKVEPILKAIIATDSSYSVVGNALQALHLYDPDAAYQDAQGFLKTNSPRDRMRQSAISVLQMTKTQTALKELIQLVDRHNIPKSTRANIVESLGNFVSVDSALVYRTWWNLTKNGDNGIRGNAINALANNGDVTTMHQLEAQENARPEMKATYDAALTRMRKRLGQ